MFHFWPSVVALFPGARVLDPFMSSGYLAVPMFFVLSGHVLGLRYLDKMANPRGLKVGRFFLLRLARVYPVHAATLLFSILLTSSRRSARSRRSHASMTCFASRSMTGSRKRAST